MKRSFSNALMPGDKLQAGKYLIVEVLGQTPFGITYLCIQTFLNEKVIVKEFILKAHFESREAGRVDYKHLDIQTFEKFRNIYLDESRALSRCSTNEHIVHVKDVFEENGTIYSVTDYINEEDLRSYVFDKDAKCLDEKDAIRIVRQIGDGLAFMHSQSVFHLDLSPEKVLLTKKGKAVIFDIGIARDNIPTEVMADVNSLNKLGYSAPEQYQRNSEQGAFTDIYSLGAILYFLLNGTDPIAAGLAATASGALKFKPTVTEKTKRAVLKAMNAEPSDRYHNINSFLNDLPHEGEVDLRSRFQKKYLYSGLAVLSLLVIIIAYVVRMKTVPGRIDAVAVMSQRDTISRNDSESLWTIGDENSVYIGVGTTRGSRPISYTEPNTTGQKDSVKIGRYYAVLIGVEEYDDKELKLANPVNDAKRLKDVLDSNYVFDNIVLLRNPNREEIFAEFQSLADKMNENDNLLLFYAGHGQYDPRTHKGYWLPRDAKQANISNWISNDQLKDFLSTMKARHIMLITDACFGGAISRGTKSSIMDTTPLFTKMTLQLYKRRSMKSISSGFLEKVPDKSPFVQYLIDNLSINDKKVLSGMDLFYSTKSSLEKGCTKEVPYPVFEVIHAGVDNGGDFFFIRRNILKQKGYQKISN